VTYILYIIGAIGCFYIANEVEDMLTLDMLELEVGYGIISVVDTEQGGELLGKIMSIRKQFAADLGIIVPPIHIRDNLDLSPDEYVFKLKGVEVAKGKVQADKFMLINSANEPIPFSGENTTEPAFGLPARWISQEDKEKATQMGFVVVDPATVMATHITEIIKNNASDIIGRDEFQKLLDVAKRHYPKLVEDLIPNVLPAGVVLKVVKNLLKEGVSVRDLKTILETIADYASTTKDPEYLTEFVRQNLGPQIVNKLKGEDNKLYVLTLEPNLEMKIRDTFRENKGLNPGFIRNFLNEIDKKASAFLNTNTQPVILTTPDSRRFIKKLIDRSMPNVSVVSTAELGNMSLETLGVIGE